MAKKRLSARQKELNRINRYFQRWEKKGLRWTEEFKESIKSKQAKTLKELTPQKLIREATGMSPKTGNIVSGFDVVRERRQMAGKKGWETRKRNRIYGEKIEQGEAILYQLDMIASSYGTVGAQFLMHLISTEIDKYGHDKFVIALAELDESIVEEATTLAKFDSKDNDKATQQYNKMVNMIRGAMPTTTEAKETGEVLDTMESGEEEIYE